jgi:hypothetical protein
MNGWEKDKRWSDKFLPEIKRVLGEHLIAEPPIEEDQKRNTDLIVLRMDAVRVACRVRKNVFLQNYGDEFTIRAGRPNSTKTELTKIVEGWGDYFFYGFADTYEEQLARWVLGDLGAFRLWFNQQLYRGNKFESQLKNNHDGSSFFLYVKVCDVPNFVVAKAGYETSEIPF